MKEIRLQHLADRHLTEDVFDGFHFVFHHFRFSPETYKQMKFLKTLDYFLQTAKM